MRMRSALEDFEANTLEAVPGLWGKFSYTCTLHDGNGAYCHWGLEKVYGRDAAWQAISAAHRLLLSQLLKTPLAVLLEDLRDSCRRQEITEQELLSSLTESRSLPKPVPPASPWHFRSVLQTLSALVENRSAASRQDA